MSWTKPQLYFTIIFIGLLVVVGLGKIGSDLVNSDRHDLDEKSVDYILQVQGNADSSGYSDIANTKAGESQRFDVMDSENGTQVSDSNDFLSTLYIKKERASQTLNLLNIVYNFPSTLLIGIGLPLSEFTDITNIIAFMLVGALIWIIWTRFVG